MVSTLWGPVDKLCWQEASLLLRGQLSVFLFFFPTTHHLFPRTSHRCINMRKKSLNVLDTAADCSVRSGQLAGVTRFVGVKVPIEAKLAFVKVKRRFSTHRNVTYGFKKQFTWTENSSFWTLLTLFSRRGKQRNVLSGNSWMDPLTRVRFNMAPVWIHWSPPAFI